MDSTKTALPAGDKVFIIQRSVPTPWPGIVLDRPAVIQEITYPAREATPDGRFPARPERTETAVFQTILSKRSTNPALGEVREYMTISTERTDAPRFGRPTVIARAKSVVGLDADENGEKLDIDELTDVTALQMAEHSASLASPQAAPELAL